MLIAKYKYNLVRWKLCLQLCERHGYSKGTFFMERCHFYFCTNADVLLTNIACLRLDRSSVA